MSTGGPGRVPPAGIPTLTEVVPWPGQAPVAAPMPTVPSLPPETSPLVPAAPAAQVVASAPPVIAPTAAVATPAAPVTTPSVPPTTPPTVPPTVPINEAQLVQRVLVDLQKQIDLMLEVRLREALAPVLARATDALMRDARKELTSVLRDAVARAVAQELARRENR